MKNSNKLKQKIIINKIVSILFSIIIIYFIHKYIIINLLSIFNKWLITVIYAFLIISILICLIYYIFKLSKIPDKKDVYYELDNNIDKIFQKYGLYITKNYVVCIGGKINLFKIFVIPIKNIEAIDVDYDSRYLHKKKGSKSSLFSFIKGSIKTDIIYRDNDIMVFNIICNKKVYCITTASKLNKRKNKEIKEMADYICNKHKNIDYI